MPTIVNDFNAVAVASNKLTTFTRLFGHAISFPEFTTDYATAKDWVGDGALIVSRSLLRASGGRGMAVSEEPQKSVDGVPTQMWVKYKRKSREYRVHVFKGRAIDTQQKRRMSGFDADAQIRNRDNGWVYTRRGVLEHPEIPMVQAQAILALTVLELDFGAVDVIYSAKKNRCWVLEVNCAPGLEGQTIESYSNAIRGFANENNSERR
ncbi:MAG: ATP-grasp domain-containing protein [Nitrososphaera sp.]